MTESAGHTRTNTAPQYTHDPSNTSTRIHPRRTHNATLRNHQQGRALSELCQLEETSASLVGSIQEGTLAKRQLLDDLIEAERQIMLSERKIQLEREMQVQLVERVGGHTCRAS